MVLLEHVVMVLPTPHQLKSVKVEGKFQFGLLHLSIWHCWSINNEMQPITHTITIKLLYCGVEVINWNPAQILLH